MLVGQICTFVVVWAFGFRDQTQGMVDCKKNGISDPLLIEIAKLGEVSKTVLSMAIDAYVARDEEKAKKAIFTATEEISQRSRFDGLVFSRTQDPVKSVRTSVPTPSVVKVANLLFGSLEMAINISRRTQIGDALEFPDPSTIQHSIKRMARDIGVIQTDAVDAVVTQNYKKAEELCATSIDADV